MAEPEVWIVLAQVGANYVEVMRDWAENWFDAVGKVPEPQRATAMFAVKLTDVHLVHLIDGQGDLPDAEVVKVQSDGSLRRVREAVDPVVP